MSRAPKSTAAASRRSVSILIRDSPAAFSAVSGMARSGAGANGCKAALSLPQIASALAIESCWPTMTRERPSKPLGRLRSGGVAPVSACTRARCGQVAVKAAKPSLTSASVTILRMAPACGP